MIKVCHMTSAHDQEDVRIFDKECCSLAAHGYDVYQVSTGTEREKNGIHLVGIGERPKNRLSRMVFFTRKVYKKCCEIDADIYHVHDPELLPYAKKLARKGKKVIFDSHEFTADQISEGNRPYIPVFMQKTLGGMYRRYETSVLRSIDAVIVPCLKNGKDYFNGNYKRMALIDNVPILGIIDNSTNVKKEKRSICYVGSITKARGIVNTIKAAYLTKCKLYLIGDMSEELKHELQQMPEYKCVEYLGFLRPEFFLPIEKKCSVGICLLLKTGQYANSDNLPTKVYQYMALGLPVVVTDSDVNIKMVQNNNCGICVNPENLTSICEGLNRILENQELANEMGENGRALSKKYCWENEEKKLLKLYEEIVREL